MNINPLIEEAFKDFEVDGEKIPISFISHEGETPTYLTYYTWSLIPDNFADDTHNFEVCYGTIDVWSNKNYKNVVESVKKTLKENNFIWTDNGAEMFDENTGYFHVPINFYIMGGVEND